MALNKNEILTRLSAELRKLSIDTRLGVVTVTLYSAGRPLVSSFLYSAIAGLAVGEIRSGEEVVCMDSVDVDDVVVWSMDTPDEFRRHLKEWMYCLACDAEPAIFDEDGCCASCGEDCVYRHQNEELA